MTTQDNKTVAELLTELGAVEFGTDAADALTARILALQVNAKKTRQDAERVKATKDWTDALATLKTSIDAFIALPLPFTPTLGTFAPSESDWLQTVAALQSHMLRNRPNQTNGKEGNKRAAGADGKTSVNTAKRTLQPDKLHKFAVGTVVYKRGTDANGTKEVPLQFPITHAPTKDGALLVTFGIDATLFAKTTTRDALALAFTEGCRLSGLTVGKDFETSFSVSRSVALAYLNMKTGATVAPADLAGAQAFAAWRTNCANATVRTIKAFYNVASLTERSSNDVFTSYAAADALLAYETMVNTYDAIAPVAESVPAIPQVAPRTPRTPRTPKNANK